MSTLSILELQKQIYQLNAERLGLAIQLQQLTQEAKKPVDSMIADARKQLIEIEILQVEDKLTPLLKELRAVQTGYEVEYEQEIGHVGSDETEWLPRKHSLYLLTSCQVDTTKSDFTPPTNWAELQQEIFECLFPLRGKVRILNVITINK